MEKVKVKNGLGVRVAICKKAKARVELGVQMREKV